MDDIETVYSASNEQNQQKVQAQPTALEKIKETENENKQDVNMED